ncbi:Thylakoid lumenal protein TL20.3, chloroplastic [Linum perenne]
MNIIEHKLNRGRKKESKPLCSSSIQASGERVRFENEGRETGERMNLIYSSKKKAVLKKESNHTVLFRLGNFFFKGADLSDTLMDRMVLNEANLKDAVLVRSVLTRSDLGGAIIDGADFSDAVLDLSQKQYASGKNPATGVDTRLSLGCGNKKRNAYGSPSSPLLSAPPPKMLDRDGFCDETSGLCDAKLD